MHRLLILCCLGTLLPAADRWIQFRSGPYEVYTNGDDRPARATLVRFEQVRHALGQLIGEPDLQTPMPVRIFVMKKAAPSSAILTARDRYAIVLDPETPPSTALMRDLTRLFLESTARMPAPIERGLEDLFSTIEVAGIRITLGKPIAQPNRDWARVHLLATSTDYYGKLRVILSNLRRGVPPDAAYRNAVAKTPAEIDRETDAYLAARNFPPTQVSPRPMSASDFTERAVEPAAASLALADLLLPDSRAAYQKLIAEKLHVTEAHEGLALLALKGGDKEAARREFAAAIAAGSAGARCYLEYGRLEPDSAKALDALRHAVKLNPKLAEAHFLIARRESDPARRLAALKSAAELNPRDAAWWEALAEEYLAQKDFPGAAKAWTSAEQAATDDASRARFLKSRLAIEQQRLDYEASERKRKADEEARDIEKLKAQARAEVRALEERVNRGAAPAKPDEKVVPWWDGPAPSGRATGTLKQVDCLGRAARLVIDAGGKLIRLLVPDPAQIAILGGGEQALGCGPQKPRRVTVEYFPKNNAKLGTAGEVATLQFQ